MAKKRRTGTRGSALLRKWMQSKGQTQAQIAASVGVRQQSVSNWLRDEARMPLSVAVRLKRLAGIPVEAWLEAAASDELAA